jgi:hypothetical protein
VRGVIIARRASYDDASSLRRASPVDWCIYRQRWRARAETLADAERQRQE